MPSRSTSTAAARSSTDRLPTTSLRIRAFKSKSDRCHDRGAVMKRLLMVAMVLAAFAPGARAALTETQTFSLQPGWNAIFVDVEPSNSDPAVVFASVPLESVWTWNGRQAGIDFVKD